MANHIIKKPCFFNNQLYPAGSVVDFGDATPPKDAVEVPNMVQKAKAAVTKAAEDVKKEDAVLKGAAKN